MHHRLGCQADSGYAAWPRMPSSRAGGSAPSEASRPAYRRLAAASSSTRAAAQSSRRDHTNGRDVLINMWLRSRNNANYNDPITQENARNLVYESLREKLERRWGERKQRGHPGASRNFIEAVHFHDSLAVNYVDLP